jgi:Zn-finger protein
MKEKDGQMIKSCIDCAFPHIPENYDKVIDIIKKRTKTCKGGSDYGNGI